MPFQSKFKIPFTQKAEEVPAEGFKFVRDKEAGTVSITIYDRKISFQKADSLAKGAFPVPVKFRGKMVSNQSTPVAETRIYDAVGWV